MNDFESPDAPVERAITVRGKTATYRFTEPTAATLESLWDIAGLDGNPDPEKFKGLRFRVISAIVTREDGSAITIDDAGKMRVAVVNALYEAAKAVIGTEKDAEAAGKDSPPEAKSGSGTSSQ